MFQIHINTLPVIKHTSSIQYSNAAGKNSEENLQFLQSYFKNKVAKHVHMFTCHTAVLPAATSSTASHPPSHKYCDMMPESWDSSLLGNDSKHIPAEANACNNRRAVFSVVHAARVAMWGLPRGYKMRISCS
jgi:hypothetical protein